MEHFTVRHGRLYHVELRHAQWETLRPNCSRKRQSKTKRIPHVKSPQVWRAHWKLLLSNMARFWLWNYRTNETIAFDGLKPSNASLQLMLVSSELITRAVPWLLIRASDKQLLRSWRPGEASIIRDGNECRKINGRQEKIWFLRHVLHLLCQDLLFCPLKIACRCGELERWSENVHDGRVSNSLHNSNLLAQEWIWRILKLCTNCGWEDDFLIAQYLNQQVSDHWYQISFIEHLKTPLSH